MDAPQMVRGAEHHQILVVILAALRAEHDVMRLQAAARRAARHPAAPAIALEDPVAPLPGRVAPRPPGGEEHVEQAVETLPVLERGPGPGPRQGPADSQSLVPERRDFLGSPEADAAPGVGGD